MKTLFIPIIMALLTGFNTYAQDAPTINLKGDANTEQSAKLELIRILNERMNKLTTAQMNSRVVVSRGVSTYYKVDEIMRMKQDIYGYRSKYVSIAGNLEKANPGFAATGGNGFAYRYMTQYNRAVETANVIAKQLQVVITSGRPILLPSMPSFSISPATSDPMADMASSMNALSNSYGIHSKEDFDALSSDKQAEFQQKANDLAQQAKSLMQQQIANGNKQVLTIMGNIVGAAFGVPAAGTLVAGILSGGGAAAIAGLVGSIVDNFQVPLDYLDSPTLKLTDAERIKMIDELHLRISETYQQVAALGASMSTETSKRYNELSQPRNEMIMYGPKK